MRFKVDENLPAEVTSTLRAAGHDAVSVIDQRMSGAADPDLASVCRTEQRALVTLDLDFSDIRTYPPGEFSGLIVLRPRSQAKPTVLSLVKQLLPLLAAAACCRCLLSRHCLAICGYCKKPAFESGRAGLAKVVIDEECWPTEAAWAHRLFRLLAAIVPVTRLPATRSITSMSRGLRPCFARNSARISSQVKLVFALASRGFARLR